VGRCSNKESLVPWWLRVARCHRVTKWPLQRKAALGTCMSWRQSTKAEGNTSWPVTWLSRACRSSPQIARGTLLLAARACARLEDGHAESISLAEQALEEAGDDGSTLQVEAKHAYGSALLLSSRRTCEEGAPWNWQERGRLLDKAVEVLSSVSGMRALLQGCCSTMPSP